MPELPEVETTLRGILPYVLHKKIDHVVVRHHGLRWPIPSKLSSFLQNATVTALTRRAKYLLFTTAQGTLIVHLGMSGKMRILTQDTVVKKHDHVDIVFENGVILRYNDPRRFGAFLWTDKNPLAHTLLKSLGPEPLTKQFNAAYVYERSRKSQTAVKVFIMDSKVVVGVGNIYAAESLFDAKIHPKRPANSLTLADYERLTRAIKKTLRAAIKKGGTTLKDFLGSDGSKGYFSLKLKVYGRGGLMCLHCHEPLDEMRLGQRSTVYCRYCQV